MNKAQIVAWLFLTAVCVGGVWRVGKPSDQPEEDRMFARQAKDAMRNSGRLKVGRRPEWERRLLGLHRLGEAKRAKQM